MCNIPVEQIEIPKRDKKRTVKFRYSQLRIGIGNCNSFDIMNNRTKKRRKNEMK